eukprot:CAMPEP_0195057004 /NCGR_PEP_ID=MMETSP0448-20130528/5231_1 /TAXON_ID=66468 /ORGANISM="Heterocapsa triquestra, Strain CCMP 448" /LENGTH=52 /DNA_ID=CAMNT_0040086913 /DNA_START=20 /DNA_END=178 /DNA_ORIENTATION=+
MTSRPGVVSASTRAERGPKSVIMHKRSATDAVGTCATQPVQDAKPSRKEPEP